MQNRLTYNKLINLLSTFYYFSEYNTLSLGYINEKYFRLYNGVPDKIQVVDNKIDIFGEEYNKVFFKELKIYKDRWKLKHISDDDIKIIFSIYFICNGLLTINSLIERFNMIYSGYSFINEESQKRGLHMIYQRSIDLFEESKMNKERLDHLKRKDKLYKIKTLLNQGPINI